jgi:NADP-dependent 3-hydroxy acid dehydrogenase YdfG
MGAAYRASRAAVAHLPRNLPAELGPRGIRVKIVEPGVTVVELGADMLDASGREALAGMRTTTTPLVAADIAAAIAYAVTVPPHVNPAESVVVPT